MPNISTTVTCPVFDSFRVQQVAGMFDVPIAERATERFEVNVPDLGRRWHTGLIVGPSGSGKSTIARKLFGDCLYRGHDWPRDKAVIDCLGERPIREITNLFTAVGFSSPPSWIKPYQVLSGGEQFRCDLARALSQAEESSDLQTTNTVAFDEYTSVVDRNVARIASAAIAKGIRKETIACRFVAVTCHYDITAWLQPDWVIDMAVSQFDRRCLQRPPIELEIFRCHRSAWRMFARHHYLSGSLNPVTRCFLALWDGVPVAFCATISMIGHKGRWRISRIVTLPDYQGVGIGMAVMEAVADLHRMEKHRVGATASHPALIAHCRRSPKWRAVHVKRIGSRPCDKVFKGYTGSLGRAVVSFEYLGDKADRGPAGLN